MLSLRWVAACMMRGEFSKYTLSWRIFNNGNTAYIWKHVCALCKNATKTRIGKCRIRLLSTITQIQQLAFCYLPHRGDLPNVPHENGPLLLLPNHHCPGTAETVLRAPFLRLAATVVNDGRSFTLPSVVHGTSLKLCKYHY